MSADEARYDAEGRYIPTEDEQERCILGWNIIEWKVAYYKPECVHRSRKADYEVSDEIYDAAEVRYLTLCRKLGRCNSVVHKGWPGFEDLIEPWASVELSYPWIEPDPKYPAVALVMSKLGSPKPRKRK